MSEPWVSAAEVPIGLGIAMDADLLRWIETKGLPAHRVGRLWKFKLSEIDEWVHAGGAGQDEPDEGKEHD